ncbi:glycosyltransferase [Thiobacter aerophilum]|uniref:Glycosyltransferase n=1 Tax=Thiobacter aerophilum TaxID=3121275 RepID=A0ABV0ECY6_9BURK
MMELLKRIDRNRFSIVCCFYSDYKRGLSGPRLSEELAALGIPLIVLPRRKQPGWAKLAKELARGLLKPWPDSRAQAQFSIEKRWRIVPQAQRIADVLRDGGFHLLYMNNQPSSNLEGYLAAESVRLPVVQHCRIDTWLNPTEVAIVNRSACRIICVSEGVAESLKSQGVQPDKLVVVHNGISPDLVLPPAVRLEGIPTGAMLIGTVGQLVKRKSVADLLNAVVALERQENLTVHLLVVGEGPEARALHESAKHAGIERRVHFVGFQRDPLPFIAAMDVFVLASSREGLPRVILEAMLLGKPVVAANAVGSRELVVDGETGLLYPHGDVHKLAAALARLLRDTELRDRLGKAGRARVRQAFSIERYVSGVERNLLEALCSGS